MKKSRLLSCSMASALLLSCVSCGNKTDKATEGFPDNFNTLSDSEKVAFVMRNASPDSVARFICDASLGRVKGVGIDSLAVAVAYAYSNYNDSSLTVYSAEFDDYSANLPLPDKMKIYAEAGKSAPQQLGYQLGLEYVGHIRESRMSVKDIQDEIAAFKTACANDSDTFNRFMKGFHTVLRIDHGKDLPEEIYTAFSE